MAEQRYNTMPCHACGNTTSVLALGEPEWLVCSGPRRNPDPGSWGGKQYSQQVGVVDLSNGRSAQWDNGTLLVWCRCGFARRLRARPVQGRKVPSIKCDARCEGAKGVSCECSCGGKNHGASHGI